MDVFSLRDRVIQDYADYVRSFVQVRDRRIDEFVQKSLRDEVLWPQPLIQLNPSFEPGGWVDDLVDRGLLHAGCRKIFRIKTEEDPIGSRMLLHRHQVEAIEAGRRGQNYVLTTGTGSGKSLTYLIPIVDRVLRNGGEQGIQAVVVYPMNALCNSQYGELDKFLRVGFGLGKEPVRFDRDTGQESREQRDEITQNPPYFSVHATGCSRCIRWKKPLGSLKTRFAYSLEWWSKSITGPLLVHRLNFKAPQARANLNCRSILSRWPASASRARRPANPRSATRFCKRRQTATSTQNQGSTA